LWCFVAVGCAGVTSGPPTDLPTDPIAAVEPIAAAIAPPAADAAATSEPASVAPVAALSDNREDSIEESPVPTEPEHAPPSVSPANIAAEASELAVVVPAAPAPEELAHAELAPSLSQSLVASPPSAETLDFSSLVTRLRKTKAINLRTKVAVKNESDELLEQARAYHTQSGETTLADLRRSYDSLFSKLHSLLEDADPPLARDIDQSRAAIWELLADPRKFSASEV
jgi:hypothetical protein